jgi:hypothetical protein
MAKPASLVTKRQLLDAVKQLSPTPAIVRGFRPDRGLATVRKAISAIKTAEPFNPAELCVDLVVKLAQHEPWDELNHHLLEPLFAAVRVLNGFGSRNPVATPIAGDKLVVRAGDVTIRGDLEIRGSLLIAGSLQVSGAIRNMGDDWSSGTLIVLGSVKAARMVCLGPTAIGGALALKDGLITSYYHDTDSTLVARRIETPIWIDRGDIAGRVKAAKAIQHKLRFQPWIARQLCKYFDEELCKVAWTDFDAAFFRKARAAAELERSGRI